MRLSRSLVPTLKENPAEAQIVSHRLMLRAGLVRQTSAGIYAWLPAGLRALRHISQIVREEQDRIGAQEVLMPTIQSADLWRDAGRYEAYGPEMLRLKDRHERDLIYGPTNELQIADLMRQSIQSYRQLPQMVYHIQWKFRDETRPRFGVMRGREFLMKDAYSFDLDRESAVISYRKMLLSYMRIYRRLGVQAVPMAADTGPIGGDLSHEFHILAPTGESQVFYDSHVEIVNTNLDDIDHNDHAQLESLFTLVTTPYAATDEKHDTVAWSRVPVERQREGRGIEVGQIFNFGTLYSGLVGLQVAGPDGKPVFPNMGSYGVGVSRLVGALIEAHHDDAGIKWPDAVSPFHASILNLKQSDPATSALCEKAYAHFSGDALYDDRDDRAGVKFADADLMGFPWQLIVGPRGAASGNVELKRRATGERQELSLDAALAHIGPARSA